MGSGMERCVVRQSRWLLAILVLFLVGAGRANAQGCSGVSPSTTGLVTWNPQWCQEFNGARCRPTALHGLMISAAVVLATMKWRSTVDRLAFPQSGWLSQQFSTNRYRLC